jgi:trimethylamine--corrinoid protein Co-methyltransferase
MALRLARNITVSEETLALDLIKKVGPGGHFLSQKHTMDWFKVEEYLPSTVIDKVSKPQWERTGAKNAFERAKEYVDKILKEHHPKPLPSDVEKRLDSFMTEILKRKP